MFVNHNENGCFIITFSEDTMVASPEATRSKLGIIVEKFIFINMIAFFLPCCAVF